MYLLWANALITLHTAHSWLLQWLRSLCAHHVCQSNCDFYLKPVIWIPTVRSAAIKVHQQDTLPLPEHAFAVMNRNCLAAPKQHREQMRVRLFRVQAEKPRAQKQIN